MAQKTEYYSLWVMDTGYDFHFRLGNEVCKIEAK